MTDLDIGAAVASITIPVACEGATHYVTVSEGGCVSTTNHGDDDEAQAVLVALGGPPAACQRVGAHITDLRRHRLGGVEAARWLALAGHPAAVLGWIGQGYTLEQAEEWIAIGVWRPGDATAWIRAGVAGPVHMDRWRQAGAKTLAEVQGWLQAGTVDPDDLADWQAAGVFAARERLAWSRLGVGHPDQLDPWRLLGFSHGVEAARWVRPRLITCPEEIPVWRSAGITDPDEARRLIVDGFEPPAVTRCRDAALVRLRYRPDGRDGRSATVLAGPGPDRFTEVYFYAYGHSCAQGAATHWLAIDFRDDDEIRGSRREGPVATPAVAAAGGVLAYVRIQASAQRADSPGCGL